VAKICAWAVAGMAQSAADAANPERINRIFTGFLSKPKGKSHFSMTRCNPAPEHLGLFGCASIFASSAYECQEFSLFQ
jgi:hypothetical protein